MITSRGNTEAGFPSWNDDPILQDIIDLSTEYFPEFNNHLRVCLNEQVGAKTGQKLADSGVFGSVDATYFQKIAEEVALGYELQESSRKAATEVVHSYKGAFSEVYRPIIQSVPESKQDKEEKQPVVRIDSFDVEAIRRDFPILSETVNGGRKLVWLDNSATTQKPRSVIERISQYYLHENSNVHRAAHALAARSTDVYEEARQKVASFLNAPSPSNIVFTRGTTEGINLVAQSYVRPMLKPGDEIILSMLEHHANIVPWQQICAETGAAIRVIPVDESGQLIVSEYRKLFNAHTRFVSVTHVSNALGTVTPVEELIAIAHSHGVRILIDGAQSVSHIPVDVQRLDTDFYVFSGHKIFGPTGIGAVYGKADALEKGVPYQGGGNMIADVTFERTLYQSAPAKFEAGTGNIADAVGLGTALDYVNGIGMARIERYEHELLVYAMSRLNRVPGLHLVGTAKEKASVLSFVLDGYSVPYVGQYLSKHGIAVRAGHHCAQPILRHYGLEATVRPSLAFYNTPEEIDFLVETLLLIS